MERRGRKISRALLIFLRNADIPVGNLSELELAPGHLECLRGRLPWRHRASPSATQHEIRYINECG
jgi:hypothetical protein